MPFSSVLGSFVATLGPRRTAVATAVVIGCVPFALTANAANAANTANTPGTANTRNAATHVHGYAAAQLAADAARRLHRTAEAPAAAAPAAAAGQEKTFAAPATTTATSTPRLLVLYDTAGSYGYLGELYAMATANLGGHFGAVTTEPVSAYTAGQFMNFTATVYIGSTYYGGASLPDAIPAAFYNDVAAHPRNTGHRLLWIGDNVWNLADHMGVQAFDSTYGWDPTNSFFAPGGNVGNVSEVLYKGRTLTRTFPPGTDSGVLHPDILGTGYPTVRTLATAVDTSTPTPTKFPWAIRSGNLTYVGEIPFAYVDETDRVIAFEDLLFDALAPATPTRHRAMVRLEDINPDDDPAQLMTVARYLYSAGIPYGFNVIPVYVDPNGYYNNGVPQTITLAQAPGVVRALKYMLAHGGTIIDEGYTHQYGDIADPYDGVSGDDFEFFLSHIDADNNVVMDGPVPQDSATWAQGRITNAAQAFEAAGLPVPKLWVTPHYAASDIDYRVFGQNFIARYERTLYPNGTLSGQPANWAAGHYIGEFFPYVVHDVYGTTVLPENLGDYEPVEMNNHPPRFPADIIHEARLNLAVRDGFASFFYDPSYGTGPLQRTVNGIRNLGYTFVSPSSLVN